MASKEFKEKLDFKERLVRMLVCRGLRVFRERVFKALKASRVPMLICKALKAFRESKEFKDLMDLKVFKGTKAFKALRGLKDQFLLLILGENIIVGLHIIKMI